MDFVENLDIKEKSETMAINVGKTYQTTHIDAIDWISKTFYDCSKAEDSIG